MRADSFKGHRFSRFTTPFYLKVTHTFILIAMRCDQNFISQYGSIFSQHAHIKQEKSHDSCCICLVWPQTSWKSSCLSAVKASIDLMMEDVEACHLVTGKGHFDELCQRAAADHRVWFFLHYRQTSKRTRAAPPRVTLIVVPTCLYRNHGCRNVCTPMADDSYSNDVG